MDYTWLAIRCEGILKQGMRVIDIGCGPGAIHGYLESKYNIEIIGIDINKWEKDYVDIVGSFVDEDVRAKNGLGPNSMDLIISTSAFEHKQHFCVMPTFLCYYLTIPTTLVSKGEQNTQSPLRK